MLIFSYRKGAVTLERLNAFVYYLFLFQISHFPGIGVIANKKALNTLNGGSKYIPKTFRVPAEKEMFLNYVSIVCQLVD